MAILTEGQATNRPPLFGEHNFSHWKDKMTLYLQATDYAMWIIITKGPKIPTKLVDNISILKLKMNVMRGIVYYCKPMLKPNSPLFVN